MLQFNEYSIFYTAKRFGRKIAVSPRLTGGGGWWVELGVGLVIGGMVVGVVAIVIIIVINIIVIVTS